MRVCEFNFNNEVDTFEIHVEDDGRVTVPGENGTTLAEYDSVEQLAEIYAQARDVKPENLKNWVLLKHGNVYSYVLRAGTAGVDVSEVEEQLENVFESLAGQYHPLNIARAKEQVMADGTVDLVDALVHCTETDIARDVYDAMSPIINGNAVTGAMVANAVAEEAEVDNRTDLEKYIDSMEEVPGALNLLAVIAGLEVGTEKAVITETLANSFALSNPDSLRTLYSNAISSAVTEGIGVNSEEDAIMVITQAVVGEKDDEAKVRLMVGARLAHRDRVNVSVDIVGEHHIRHTAELVPVEELEGLDLVMRGSSPVVVRFNAAVDAELEAERDAEAAGDQDTMDEEDPEEDGYDEDGYDEDGEEY